MITNKLYPCVELFTGWEELADGSRVFHVTDNVDGLPPSVRQYKSYYRGGTEREVFDYMVSFLRNSVDGDLCIQIGGEIFERYN